jgi:hypothetical protein
MGVTMLAGGGVGVAVCYALVDRPHGAVVLMAALLGVILANALRQAVRSGL